jgi:3-hydroxybutyrate dehydrogenase
MLTRLDGQVALVTGSTSGIGLGIARELVESGARVILNGIETPEQGAGIAREFGKDAVYLHADLSRTDAIVNLMAAAETAFGRLDILVNNAGIQHVAPLASFPPEKYDLIIALNQSSVFHTTRLALPMMRRLGRGRIINIASAHGLVASPFKSAYVAAKHAVVGLTKVTALETAEENITANTICPGYVLTPLVEAQIPREAVIRDVLLAQQPNKKFATVAEIGALTVFLASDAAASITGAALPVDGGWTAH